MTKSLNMKGIKQAKQLIKSAKTVVIAGHINPDGDAIGSLLALGLGLKKIGKRVYMLDQDGVPKRYHFLPGASQVKKKAVRNCDLAIAVDCSNKELLGKVYTAFQTAKQTLAIDHHEFRRQFSDCQLVDPQAAAVGEMVYLLLNELKIPIDKSIALNILTSIIVETNSFRLPNVRPLTFKVCNYLLNLGVDYYQLADRVFWSQTRQTVVLTGICLARCKFLSRNRIAWSIVEKRDFNLAKGKDEDVDAVADQIRTIDDVKVVVLFREKDNNTLRISLRSKDKINVAAVAEQFNGGGHYDIAGCSIPNTKKAMRKLLKATEELFKKKSKDN